MPSFQGKGLMNEALKCIINYGFQTIGLEKIGAYTHRETAVQPGCLKRIILNLTRNDMRKTIVTILSIL